MSSREPFPTWKAFLPPLVFSIGLVAMAAATRKLSNWLEQSLGSRFVPFLAAVVILAGALVLGVALARIRSERWVRYSTLGLGLSMVALPIWLSERGSVEQAAVERMHFVLYGLLGVLFFRAFAGREDGWAAPILALLAATQVGVVDEAFQWYLALRTGELFDVGLNAYSSLCGVVLSLGLFGFPARHQRAPPRAVRGLGILAAALVLSVAGFLHFAHLGSLVADPECGSFRSYFERQRLLQLDAERDREWSLAPPSRPFGTLEREDYFQTEAGEHLRLRNRAFEAGQMAVARREQLILERYYSAFLELDERYPDGPFRYRLAPWDLEKMEKGAAEQAESAVPQESEAGRDRIWLRPKAGLLWTVAVTLAAVILSLSLGSSRHRDLGSTC